MKSPPIRIFPSQGWTATARISAAIGPEAVMTELYALKPSKTGYRAFALTGNSAHTSIIIKKNALFFITHLLMPYFGQHRRVSCKRAFFSAPGCE